MAVISRRPTPDPRISAPIELSGRDAGSLFDLIIVSKTLACQGVTSEEAPPALLQVQPAGSFRDEDVVEARMLCQPGACLSTIVAGKVVSDDENVARRSVGFDVGK